MKNMKRLTAFILTLLLVFGMTTSVFATGTPENSDVLAGQKTVVEFRFENIAAIRGTFSYSNPDLFSDVSVSVSGLSMGIYNSENGQLAYYHSSAVEEVVITLTLTVSETAQADDFCEITLEYEATADGYLPSDPEYSYDKVTVTVYAIDYTELNNQIAIAESLNEKEYTSESWDAMQLALASAKAALTATSQMEVDRAASVLKKAIEDLKAVNYDELNRQIANAEKLSEKDYTDDSWKNLQTALNAAKNALNSNSQTEIDQAATALKKAIEELEPVIIPTVDYTELNRQIANAEKLSEKDYTDNSWKNLQTALDAAKNALNSDSQSAVNRAATKLKDAINALVAMNYTELNRQIAVAKALNRTEYTAQSWVKLESALEAAKTALESRNQSEVDAVTNQLKNAIASLVPAISAVDYTALKKQIQIAKDLNEAEYTTASWANLQTALLVAEAALTSNSQGEVDRAAAALKTAIEELVKVVIPSVDYTELNRQIAIAEGLNGTEYTAGSWVQLTNALSQAKAALESEVQSEVDLAALNLKNAIAQLQKIVVTPLDYTELNHQISIADGLVAKDYTADSWKVFADVLAEAEQVKASALTQTEVDTAAKNLKDAIAALVSMDYSVLLEAIQAVNNLKETDTLSGLWFKLHQQLILAETLLESGDQAAVNQCAAEITRLLGEIASEMEKLKETETVIVDKPVPTEPTDPYCNIGSHRVWPILFWISLALNIAAIALIVVFLILKRKKRSDDTPLVDYDIEDDTK